MLVPPQVLIGTLARWLRPGSVIIADQTSSGSVELSIIEIFKNSLIVHLREHGSENR